MSHSPSHILETRPSICHHFLCVALFLPLSLPSSGSMMGMEVKSFATAVSSSCNFLCSSQSHNISVCHDREEWPPLCFPDCLYTWALLRACKCNGWRRSQTSLGCLALGFLHVLLAWQSCGGKETCSGVCSKMEKDRKAMKMQRHGTGSGAGPLQP